MMKLRINPLVVEDLKGIKSFIAEDNADKKYEILCDSGILNDFLKSPLIIDTINNYIIYVITGKLEDKLANSGVVKKGKNKSLEEKDIITFLTNNLQKRYNDAGVVISPNYHLVESFFSEIFILGSNYIFEQMSKEETAMMYFINYKISLLGNGVAVKLDEIVSILKQRT